MQLGEVVKSKCNSEVIPESSDYPRWYIFLAAESSESLKHYGLLITTTTKIVRHKIYEPNCILFSCGDFGFTNDCCANTQQIFRSKLDKIKNWSKKGKIDDEEILMQIYSNIEKDSKDVLLADKKSIKNSYIEAGIINR